MNEIYEYIVDGIKKYGNNLNDICIHHLGVASSDINENVIMAPTWKPQIFSEYIDNIELLWDGYLKIWNITYNNKKITYINTNVGAPNVIEAVIALSFTLCKNVCFIGSVGSLDNNINIGDIVIPEYSISGDGTIRYLSKKLLKDNDNFGKKCYPNKSYFDKIVDITKQITQENNIKYHIGHVFSIDTILAQFCRIDEIKNMGCNCIEMESALLFEATNICNINSIAVFSVSDNTVVNKSLISGRTNEEIEYRKNIRNKIITKIVLNGFF
jgi:purine-nucleoside phosphorylase